MKQAGSIYCRPTNRLNITNDCDIVTKRKASHISNPR